MKSIMQEASSIAKAIEQGWIKAGKPQEFSVKVFEEAQKNFIGLTTKSAKIALLFNENSVKAPRATENQADRARKQQPQQAPVRQAQPAKPAVTAKTTEADNRRPVQKTPTAQQPARPASTIERRPLKTAEERAAEPSRLERRPLPAAQEGEQPVREKTVWNDEMSQAAQVWMKHTLDSLNLSHVQFTTEVNQQVLAFSFNSPLVSSNERQRHLFRSFAFLMMQTMRHQFKKSCRNLRIVFTAQKHGG